MSRGHPSRISAGAMRLVREPLIHFLLIGVSVFALQGLTAAPRDTASGNRIVIDAGDLGQLARLWERRWQRAPTPDEMRGLIAERVREEVFYREALALGLDRDDVVIRRHLAQKFAFLTDDLSAARGPDIPELAAWYAANQERYRTPARISFTQIYFSPDRRGAAAGPEARLILARLRAGEPGLDPGVLGDGRLLDATYEDQTAQQVEALFGRAFAASLFPLEVGTWAGPIRSGYGLHLVHVGKMTPGTVPPLGEIEERVRNDWAYEQRQRANEAVYRELLARYSVTIEATDPSVGGRSDGEARP